MNPSDAMMQLKALGYTLDSGYVFNGKYRYGRIFEDAFLFSEAKRYDVKGRNYLNYPMKYYCEDIGLRNARLGFRQMESSHIMENIVYNELVGRGFNVDAGMVTVDEKD